MIEHLILNYSWLLFYVIAPVIAVVGLGWTAYELHRDFGGQR